MAITFLITMESLMTVPVPLIDVAKVGGYQATFQILAGVAPLANHSALTSISLGIDIRQIEISDGGLRLASA